MKRRTKRQAKSSVAVLDKPVEQVITDPIEILKKRHAEEMEEAILKQVREREQARPPLPEIKTKEKPAEAILWEKPKAKPTKSGKVVCDVIANGVWYENQKVALGDIDIEESKWAYYGSRKPVLIKRGNELLPYVHSDVVGDSPPRLFKGANPEGWKGTWTHHSGLLEKLKIGMMVALVIATFVLIYVLINQSSTEVYAWQGITDTLKMTIL